MRAEIKALHQKLKHDCVVIAAYDRAMTMADKSW